MNISLQFIADKAKVSPSLVSQVLRNKDVRVSAETKRRIIEIAKKYEYTPNRMAASLRTKKTNTIALILPFAYIEFFAKLIYFIQVRALEAGYSVLVCNTFEDADIEKKYIELYRSNMVDGIIIAPLALNINVQQYKNINEMKFPVIFVDRYFPNLSTNYVCTDNVTGAYNGTIGLINKGCKNIFVIYRKEITSTTIYKDRLKGYKRAMKEAGFEESITEISFEINDEGNPLYSGMVDKPEPDGLFIMSSYDLCLLYDTCAKLQYNPKNIRFLAFDNYSIPSKRLKDEQFMQYAKASLTIIDQNVPEMGEKAFDMLLRKIKKQPIENILINAKIIEL